MGKKKGHNQRANNVHQPVLAETDDIEINPSQEAPPTDDDPREDGSNELAKCPHLQGVNIERVKELFRHGNALSCVGCLLSAAGSNSKGNKKGNKKNATARKKKGGGTRASTDSDVWICVTCAHLGCGREEAGHAKEHQARSTKHALAIQYGTCACWCYSCDTEIVLPATRSTNSPFEKLAIVADFLKRQLAGTTSEGKKGKKKGTDEQSEETELASSQELQALHLDFSKHLPALRGLRNLGNTCFFNSVMQNLAHSRGLYDTLRSFDMSTSPGYARLTSAFLQFLSHMSSTAAAGSVFSPGHLFQEVCRKAPRFRGFQQQDAHELLHYLLDGVNDEELKRLKSTPPSSTPPAPRPSPSPDAAANAAGSTPAPSSVASSEGLPPVATAPAPAVVTAEVAESPAATSLPLEPPTSAPTTDLPNPSVSAVADSLPGHAASPASSSSVVPSSPSSLAPVPKLTEASPPAAPVAAAITGGPSSPVVGADSSTNPAPADSVPASAEPDETAPEAPPSSPKPRSKAGAPRARTFPLTFVELVFGGVMVSSVTCHTCRHLSATPEYFLDVSLPIHNAAKVVREDDLRVGSSSRKKKAPPPRKLSKAQKLRERAAAMVAQAAAAGSGQASSASAPTAPAAGASPTSVPAPAAALPTSLDATPVTVAAPSHTQPAVPAPPAAPGDAAPVPPEPASAPAPAPAPAPDAAAASAPAPTPAPTPEPGPALAPAPAVPPAAPPLDIEPIAAPSAGPADDAASDDEGHEEPAPKLEAHHFDRRSTSDGLKPGAGGGGTSLEQCLWSFTSPELLDGENAFGCEECTRQTRLEGRKGADLVKRRATKQVLLRTLPRVLVLHLKRFHQTARGLAKLSTAVQFPLRLNVSAFCEAPAGPAGSRRSVYALNGVVEHSGSLHGGHYTAYVLQDRSWYYFSDAHWNAASEAQVLSAEAYILFYELVDA